MSEPVDVPIDDEVIKLGQFLKLANLIDSGSEAKTVIAQGLVRVNDEVELRRGRQLQVGDVVVLAGHRVRGGGGKYPAPPRPGDSTAPAPASSGRAGGGGGAHGGGGGG